MRGRSHKTKVSYFTGGRPFAIITLSKQTTGNIIMENKIVLITFITLICGLLYVTSPLNVVPECEKVNTKEMCNILNAE